MRTPAALLALALVLAGCEPEVSPPSTATGGEPSPAEQLAALGKLARSAHPQIEIRGGVTGTDIHFAAQYAPAKNTLTYELTNPQGAERIVVDPEGAMRSTSGGPDLEVNRESFMPNGKDWPYGSRMAAPFLDAIDGYAATIHSFHIEAATPPDGIEGGASLAWFDLKLNRDNAHDLLLLEFSKVSSLKIGVDRESGLLRSLVSLPGNGEPIPTEIRAE